MKKTDLASITLALASFFVENTTEQTTTETTEIRASNLCKYEAKELQTIFFGQYERVMNQPCVYQLPHKNQKKNTIYRI